MKGERGSNEKGEESSHGEALSGITCNFLLTKPIVDVWAKQSAPKCRSSQLFSAAAPPNRPRRLHA